MGVWWTFGTIWAPGVTFRPFFTKKPTQKVITSLRCYCPGMVRVFSDLFFDLKIPKKRPKKVPKVSKTGRNGLTGPPWGSLVPKQLS